METLSIEDYKMIQLNEVQEFRKNIDSLSELRFVLNESWFNRVREVINRLDNGLKIDDGAYDLFEIFLTKLNPILLNQRLEKVEAISRQQDRLRSYRKTRRELASTQTNQILGSLFEINIVYAAIQSCSSVEAFPKTGNGGSDVDAKLIIDNRPIFIEAKALTYSKHDVGARSSGKTGSHSVPSMIRQIYDALDEKLAKGKQLHILLDKVPTALFLALGFNADPHSGSWGIESYYQKSHSNVSSIFLFGSALCREPMRAFYNENSSFPLSQKEREVFKTSFYQVLVTNNVT